MISAISAQGALRFLVLTGPLTAAGVIAVLERLLHDAEHNGSDPVLCIVGNRPAHRATAVDRFVDSTDGALRLFRLPACSPQLNPDERVWENVEHGWPPAPKGPEQMKAVVTACLRRLQRLPQIVQDFFDDPTPAYVTAGAWSRASCNLIGETARFRACLTWMSADLHCVVRPWQNWAGSWCPTDCGRSSSR